MSKIIQLTDGSGNVYPQLPNKLADFIWASGFVGSTAAFTFRRWGNIVVVTANFTTASAISSATEMGTIPTGFTPSANVRINGLSYGRGERWQIEFSSASNGSGAKIAVIGGDTITAGQYIRFQTVWYTGTDFPS